MLERLVFPRSKKIILNWLDNLSAIKNIRWLVPAHYNAPLEFSRREIVELKNNIQKRDWAISSGNWKFLGSLDSALLKIGVLPKDPIPSIKD